MSRGYKDLEVWQMAMDLVVECYRSPGDFSRFLDIAYGSLMELETQLMLANRLDYMGPQATDALLTRTGQIGKLLNGLRTSVRSR